MLIRMKHNARMFYQFNFPDIEDYLIIILIWRKYGTDRTTLLCNR